MCLKHVRDSDSGPARFPFARLIRAYKAPASRFITLHDDGGDDPPEMGNQSMLNAVHDILTWLHLFPFHCRKLLSLFSDRYSPPG
jgi:hypothetical protein